VRVPDSINCIVINDGPNYPASTHLTPNIKTARWIQRLQEYNLASEHRQGRRHINADALSRRPCPEGCSHCQKIEQWGEGLKVGIITTAAADGWVRASLRREQLADDELGPLLQEVEAGQRPEWKHIADRSPTYKSYWAQWKSLVVRDGVLERLWESVSGRTKTAQVVIPRNKVKEVLTEMQGGGGCPEDTSELTRHSPRSNSGITGYTRGTTSKDGVNNVTPAQLAEVPELEPEA
jgi:hypothetical protein